MVGSTGARATARGGRGNRLISAPHHPESPVTESLTPLAPGSLSGKTALVTGSSRGIGADTVRYFAQAGADVVINYRNKAPRAEKLAARAARSRASRRSSSAPISPTPSRFRRCSPRWSGRSASLDILVLNASGGMESGMGEDYALQLNRDAQVSVLETALPLLGRGLARRVRHESPGALHPRRPRRCPNTFRSRSPSGPARTRCASASRPSTSAASNSSSSRAT